MKKRLLIVANCLAALALATTGCNNDNNPDEATTPRKFRITAGLDSRQDTRLSFKDEIYFLKISWRVRPDDASMTDKISVFTGEDKQRSATFAAAALVSEDGRNAIFEPQGQIFNTPNTGTRLFAYTMGSATLFFDEFENNGFAPTAIPLDVRSQCGNLDSLYTNFSMYATAISDGTENLNFSFKHTRAMVKLVLRLDEANAGDKIGWIGLSSPDMHNKATLDMTTGQITYKDNDKGGVVIQSAPPGYNDIGVFTLNDDRQATVWLSVFPEDLRNVIIFAQSHDQQKYYQGSLTDCNLQAGRMYTAEVDLVQQP